MSTDLKGEIELVEASEEGAEAKADNLSPKLLWNVSNATN